MNIKKKIKKANVVRMKVEFACRQIFMKRQAYNIGYAGKRLPHFSTLGEDSEQKDFERVVRVYVIDKNNNAPSSEFDAAEKAIIPSLYEYVRGLKDGRREKGNSPVFDQGKQFDRLVAAKQGIKVIEEVRGDTE